MNGLAYVDEEALLVAWLPTAVTPAPRVGTATPADPNATYAWVANGFVKVARIGGGGRFGVDAPRIFVECFHTSYGAAKALGLAVRVAFESPLIGYSTPTGTVLDVVTNSGPSWAPYDDVRLSRFVATYQLTTQV